MCAFVFELSTKLTGKGTFVISFVKKNVWNGSWAGFELNLEGPSEGNCNYGFQSCLCIKRYYESDQKVMLYE